MTSYFRAWWTGTATTAELGTAANGDSPGANVVTITTPDETEDATDDSDDNTPPAFPSLTSIQRTSAPPRRRRTRTPAKRADVELMPPPPLPSPSSSARAPTASLIPPVPNNIRMPAPPRGSASNTLQLPPSTVRAPAKRREKVALAPGHSPLDWAALKTSGRDLRGGVAGLSRITPSQLKGHSTRDDAWAAFNGKVYNITPYLAFHPGGEKELMRVAGRDGSKLFGLTHAWVNVEFMLDECLVGFLVPEASSAA